MSKPDFFCTGRREGHTRSPGTLGRLLSRRHWPKTAARAEQVHGSLVRIVPRLASEKTYPKADGLLTNAADQPLAIFTADCVPVFLSAPSSSVVGILHAGWRGVHVQILRQALRLMKRQWRVQPSQVDVWAGPSIGRCCFEVQWDVARHFPFSRRRRKDRWTVDLVAELKHQAISLGVRWRTDRTIRRCTAHDRTFFSFRREATENRQVSVIRMSPL